MAVYEPVDEGLLDEVTNLQEEEHKLREIVNAKRNQVLGKLKEQLGSAFEVKEEVGSQHQGDQRHEREGSSDQEGNAAKEKQVLSTEQVHELEAALKEVNKLVQSLSRDLPRSLDASNITVKSVRDFVCVSLRFAPPPCYACYACYVCYVCYACSPPSLTAFIH